VYVGRFAPSPSGPLHTGSLVVAIASYVDARAAAGQWLVRMEDLDAPRVVPGADQVILSQLKALGMQWDAPPWYQSERTDAYQAAFDRLLALGRIYPCACTRREIADSVVALHGTLPHGERPYPGTCRTGLAATKVAKSWRFRVTDQAITFNDRWCGPQSQNVAHQVGDFVLRRADGIWAYQLAVVVDDTAQGVTDIVRGQDLLSSTARQHQLANALGLRPASVMHVPLVFDERGLKLSKQNGAPPINTADPLQTLSSAWRYLGLGEITAHDLEHFWSCAITRWAQRYRPD
jgi:glutamyl-Q tRNA(Asp) synthetase